MLFLLYCDVTVNQPFEQVEAELTGQPLSWIPALVERANGHGNKLLSELGFDIGKRRLGRRIEVNLGVPRRTEGVTLIPIGWRAASAVSLFPTLDGQLEIAKLSVETTRLAISAGYDPPLGFAGRVADRALLHRVAEVTVRDFIERIGDRLEHTD